MMSHHLSPNNERKWRDMHKKETPAPARPVEESSLRAEQVPEGWRLVPVEPTKEMEEAGKVGIFESSFAHNNKGEIARNVYVSMLDAAPESPSSRASPAEGEVAECARQVVVEWLDMFDPPPQIDFQQSELLQGAIADALDRLSRRVAELELERDAALKWRDAENTELNVEIARAEEAEAQRDAALEVLEPFAEAADILEREYRALMTPEQGCNIKFKALVAARDFIRRAKRGE